MIIVRLQGGLGNKMFQYALYKAYVSIGKDASIDDYSFMPSWDFENIGLKDVFESLEYDIADKRLIDRLSGRNSVINKFRRIYRIPLIKKSGYVYEKKMTYDKSLIRLDGDVYLSGNWQSEKYFVHIMDEIRRDYNFKEIIGDENIRLVRKLKSENTVSIHIRKGADYNKKLVTGTCQKEYYKNAIKLVEQKVSKPIYYIFTDNVDWVKENIDFIQYSIIDWNSSKGKTSYIDMQLMSMCKHNIIANSTYSWWGAWLNSNNEKVIVAPQQWFNGSKKNRETVDLIPDKWLRV